MLVKIISILLVLCNFSNAFASDNTNTAASTLNKNNPSAKEVTVGIVMPMDHRALREIVAGFKEKFSTQLELQNPGAKINFKVQNAQGDMNVQHGIIQQFLRQEVDIVVPIGTAATQMTATLVKKIPIVSLAANFPEEIRLQQQQTNITGVVDEIGPEKPLDFLVALKPNLKKITLIYSNSEKVYPEVAAAIQHAAKKGVEIQKLMIQSLPELYTISRLIDKDSEAIFILKDHLIVSGVQTLLKLAKERSIPLMSSDEGSVKEGAGFALGVKERSIGEEGAVLAAAVLQGKSLMEMPIKKLSDLLVFYNPNACELQDIAIPKLKETADQQNYGLLVVEQGS